MKMFRDLQDLKDMSRMNLWLEPLLSDHVSTPNILAFPPFPSMATVSLHYHGFINM